ncbi:MAG: MotA/TolQ/ExbB proton channel family protein [Myxococcota bacterium]
MSVPSLVRVFVDALWTPVLVVLAVTVLIALVDTGVAVGERVWGLAALRKRGDAAHAEALARARIGRADVLARVGPMLGLMGTLIPLGPGLAALGNGNVAVLAQAVTVAFDTTVMGLLVGVLAFIVSRLRRRWYDAVLDDLEAADA